MEHCWTDGNYKAFNEAKKDLNHTILMEETFLRHKYYIQWLKECDKNTRFFHAVASKKLKRSLIRRIKDSNNTWVEDQWTIGALAETYFKKILSSEEHYIDEAILQLIPKQLTKEANELLTRLPAMEEVRDVVFSMSADSSPGPDGFSGAFYRVAWEILKYYLLHAVFFFFQEVLLLELLMLLF